MPSQGIRAIRDDIGRGCESATLGYNGHTNASYLNPFVSGFTNANLDAIIPVNAIPGRNRLEVWWFRKSALDPAKGLREVYWPSVAGRYTIQWPANAREIVLASLEAKGKGQAPTWSPSWWRTMAFRHWRRPTKSRSSWRK